MGEGTEAAQLVGRGVEQLPVVFLVVDQRGTISFCSDQISVLGYVANELLGSPVSALFLEGEWQRLREAALAGAVSGFATEMQSRQGTPAPMEFAAAPIRDNGITRIILMGKDERVKRQVGHYRRFEAVKRMVSGVAHELNNPLQTVVGNAEMLVGMKLSESAGKRAQRVLGGARRCQEVVNGLLKLKRHRLTGIEQVDLDALVRRVCREVGREFAGHPIPCSIHIEDPIPMISGYSGDLEQALVNVVRNAFQAVGPEGEVRVEVSSAGEEVAITVSDNGAGMDLGVQERAFEPFFTTRKVGEGKGLGLSIALGIVMEHGGEITLQSRGGSGTRVKLQLPLEHEPGAELPL